MKKKEETTAKAQSKSVYVRGILTDAFYGSRSFAKGKESKDKYRISIKAVPDDMEALVKAAEPFYEDTEEKWQPKWFTDEDAREYLNLASNYDIKAGLRDPETKEIQEVGYLIDDYIKNNGNINGSKVVIMLTLKEGAIYPVSILIREIHRVTIADMFNDFDDDMPF